MESPLAGLHFTEDLVADLQSCGVGVVFITLHSVGSWLPFLEDEVESHEMHAEWFSVPEETATEINLALSRGSRVVACGSTSLRAIESAAGDNGHVTAQSGRTKLYASPGYRFKTISGYFTNFHQQRSSLMVLDSAFAGRDLVLRAYEYAADHQYGFYEFGDAVFYK